MKNENEYKLICTFKYNRIYKIFELNEIGIADKDIIIAGKERNINYKAVYENVNTKENSYNIFLDSVAINTGFYLESPIELDDIVNTIESVTNDTYIVYLLTFKCSELDEKREFLKLRSYQRHASDEEIKKLIDEYRKFISRLILEAYLYKETNLSQNAKVLEFTNALPVFKSEKNNEPKVRKIINDIKKSVIAQDEAIEKIVPVILLNQKLNSLNNEELLKTQKSNILIEGPSGVGKTLILEELSKIIDIPIVIKDITNYSTVGYVGEDLKQVLVDLIYNADGNIKKAEEGIICFDEIDKLGDSTLEIRKGIQQELLSWMNGTVINIKYKDKKIAFNTSKVTFVGLGAFEKLKERDKNKKSIGFESKNENILVEHNTDDYIWFGMQREIMGRFNNLVSLKSLTEENLKSILLDSKISPLKNFIELASIYNVEVSYSEDFINKIVTSAYKDNIGARGLLREMNKIRNEYLIPLMSEELETINLGEEDAKRMLKL